MKNLVLSAAFAMAIIPAAARPADQTTSREKLFQDLREVEMTLERMRSLIPPSFDLAAERKAIDSLARKAELSRVDVKVVPGIERLSLDDGKPTPMELNRLEIAGRGRYSAVHFFLTMLRHRSRLLGVESLRLDAGQGENVRFTGRLTYPSWSVLPPDDVRPSDIDSALRRRLTQNRAIRDRIVATMTSLREGGSVDALAVFTNAVEEHAIALTSVRIDDGISMEGLFLGAAARAAVPASLEKAKLRPSRMQITRSGVCHAFSIHARFERAEETEGSTSGRPVFDGDSPAFCRDQPGSPRRILVRDAASRDATSKDVDAFFLRLRNLDLVDVFFVLNDLIAENFVIDQDVKGRIDLDVLEQATVDDALKGLSSEGLVIGSPPLRRVSRGTPAVLSSPRPTSGGAPISISMRDVNLSGILCVLGEVLQREMRMARTQQRRVSMFATELPAGDALDQLVPPPGTTTMNACELGHDSGSRLSAYRLKPEQMGIEDLRIAGLARTGDTWKAYAYTPSRRVMALEPDQRLFDGSVKSIGPKGVTFTSGDKGVVTVPFVP